MVQIAVIQKGSAWNVLRDGVPVSEGLRRSDAIALGEQLSFEAEENEAVELLVQDYTGEVKTTYSGTE